MTGQFITLFCRYVGAIITACAVSFGVFAIGLPLLMWAELPGFYVHSDDPASAPSFSVIAPDLYRLVRKTIKYYDAGDEHEYYIETKWGKRHQLERLFTDYDLEAMKIFKEITDRFPWVEIDEEVQR